ncbi:hypothetical protein AVEN_86863-1 [Araneus ventricosus]|uniref:Uncharacterized protein n=1 Tax=Araneus ventricosus TaxID=182803 RepID=A0A4Y2P1C9_ARAVE|nr:hypothetical protein AVEN_86863-1 [Araneus ventricosus]
MIMPKSLEIFVDHRHRINQDWKDGVSHENLSKSKNIRIRVSTICARSMRRQDSWKVREGKAEYLKTSAREDSVSARLAQKKNDILSRDIVEDLKLNVPALTVRLIIKNTSVYHLYQKKKDHTSQTKT